MQAHLDQGIRALKAKEYGAALGWFDKAVELDPHNTSAYLHRGLAHSYRRDHDLALVDFEKAVQLEPQDPFAYLHRGNCHHERDAFEKAIEDFTTAIRLDPNEVDPFIYRAYAYLELKKPDLAFADADRAVRMKPTSADAFTARADVHHDRKQFAKSAADYQEACRLDSKAPGPRNGLAWLWATCPLADFRNGTAAVDLARRACELTEWNDGFYFDTLAAAYAEAGNFEEAMKWQQKAVDDPKAFHESERPKVLHRLQLYQQRQPYRDDS
jgi:tetratricopeptide (TPR) repeat protein